MICFHNHHQLLATYTQIWKETTFAATSASSKRNYSCSKGGFIYSITCIKNPEMWSQPSLREVCGDAKEDVSWFSGTTKCRLLNCAQTRRRWPLKLLCQEWLSAASPHHMTPSFPFFLSHFRVIHDPILFVALHRRTHRYNRYYKVFGLGMGHEKQGILCPVIYSLELEPLPRDESETSPIKCGTFC